MWEFHGGLVVRIPDFHCHGMGSMLSWETKILQVAQHGQKIKIEKLMCLFLLSPIPSRVLIRTFDKEHRLHITNKPTDEYKKLKVQNH